MKRKLLFFLLLPALLLSCTKDPEATKYGDIKVEQTAMTFSSEGETQLLKVKANSQDKWTAYSKMSWIEIGEPDYANGTVEITVNATEEIEDLVAEVVIYNDMGKTQSVTVTQKGNGILHDRSTLKRMNIHGDVSAVSFHFDPICIWDFHPCYLSNMTFNNEGMLTYYEYFFNNRPYGIINYAGHVEYDDQNRMTRLYITSDAYVDGDPFELSLDFTYGDHGKYIEIERFLILLDNTYTFTAGRMWMPRMIKNLESVTVNNMALTNPVWKFELEMLQNNNAVVTATIGDLEPSNLYEYKFEGAYTRSIIFQDIAFGLSMLLEQVYDIIPESGYFKSKTLQLFGFDSGGEIQIKRYLPNLANTNNYFYDLDAYGFDMSVDYDSHCNATEIKETYWGVNSTFEYEYDSHGNWISFTPTLAIDATFPLETERTITYRK